MNGIAGDARFRQIARELVGTVFGAGEHQYLTPLLAGYQMLEQFGFAPLVDGVHHLVDTADRRIGGRDLNLFRLMQKGGKIKKLFRMSIWWTTSSTFFSFNVRALQ